jgi:hypothetical protein
VVHERLEKTGVEEKGSANTLWLTGENMMEHEIESMEELGQALEDMAGQVQNNSAVMEFGIARNYDKVIRVSRATVRRA